MVQRVRRGVHDSFPPSLPTPHCCPLLHTYMLPRLMAVACMHTVGHTDFIYIELMCEEGRTGGYRDTPHNRPGMYTNTNSGHG